MESDSREGIEEKIENVAKFWSALSEEDLEYIQAVRMAIEDNLPWPIP